AAPASLRLVRRRCGAPLDLQQQRDRVVRDQARRARRARRDPHLHRLQGRRQAGRSAADRRRRLCEDRADLRRAAGLEDQHLRHQARARPAGGRAQISRASRRDHADGDRDHLDRSRPRAHDGAAQSVRLKNKTGRSRSHLVPMEGLEPPRCYPPVPETGASTNSATSALEKQGADCGGEGYPLSMKKKPPAAGTGDWRKQDPDHAREQERHEQPIPSRRYIRTVLRDEGAPLTLEELCAHFGLEEGEHEALKSRLQAMVREGEIAQNRRGAYGEVKQMNLVSGVIQAHRDGFGFLIPDEGGPDVFLPPRQMRELMNGDRALVRITGVDERGRREGALADVLERGSRTVVGRLHAEQGVTYVIPDNPRVQQDLLIPPESRASARHGQMVVAEIVTPPGKRTLPVGRVTEILGEHLAPGMEIEAAIRAHGLPHVFPDAVEREAAEIPDEVRAEDRAGREDLRGLPLMTIDGVDARDFDDAVFAQRAKDGWKLWVAIADVSAYVKPGAPLDEEGLKRGNSVYFPQRVIPMLPEKLSNGLCSLNPDVDRLCMVCEMRVTPKGEIAQSRFFESVMRSRARLIYEDVARILENPDGAEAHERPHIVEPLQVLNEVFEALF